jgi:hypothetical protein
MEFFRHCPGCGKRFHIKTESKKMVHLGRESTHEDIGLLNVSQFQGWPVITAQEPKKPLIVDVEEFQYKYKCGHCGHEWTEKRVVEHREP